MSMRRLAPPPAVFGLTVAAAMALAALTIAGGQTAQPGGPFDLVLAGGRVMDPASRLDGIRHVGIRGAARLRR